MFLAPIDKKKYNKMLEAFYAKREWTSDGVPTAEKLSQLGLKQVARQLHPLKTKGSRKRELKA